MIKRFIFRLAKLSDKSKMEFIINKVKHLGANDQKYQHHLNNEQLVTTLKERDVIVNETLKLAEYIGRCVEKSNQVLGMIRRNIS